jgi:hypothetical protein
MEFKYQRKPIIIFIVIVAIFIEGILFSIVSPYSSGFFIFIAIFNFIFIFSIYKLHCNSVWLKINNDYLQLLYAHGFKKVYFRDIKKIEINEVSNSEQYSVFSKIRTLTITICKSFEKYDFNCVGGNCESDEFGNLVIRYSVEGAIDNYPILLSEIKKII